MIQDRKSQLTETQKTANTVAEVCEGVASVAALSAYFPLLELHSKIFGKNTGHTEGMGNGLMVLGAAAVVTAPVTVPSLVTAKVVRKVFRLPEE